MNLPIKIILIPIGLLSVLFFLLSTEYESDGLWINLSTELVGIIITVGFVDWILKRYQKNEWKEFDERVQRFKARLLNKIILAIRTQLDIPLDVDDLLDLPEPSRTVEIQNRRVMTS